MGKGEFERLPIARLSRPPRPSLVQPHTSSAGPARGSPRASSWCRAGPKVVEAGPAMVCVSSPSHRPLPCGVALPPPPRAYHLSPCPPTLPSLPTGPSQAPQATPSSARNRPSTPPTALPLVSQPCQRLPSPLKSPAGPARGSPRASSWCRAGPRVCEAGPAFCRYNTALSLTRRSLALPLLAGAKSSDAARTAAGATPAQLAASSAGKATGGE